MQREGCVRILLNGEPRDVSGGATVQSLLEELGVRTRGVAVERNLELVPRGRHGECRLAEGDRVEIVTFVGGG
jgi:thiamine biosynthesis protein ThiS